MPKICYQDFNFRPNTLEIINQANAIIEEYQKQGYDLTLRQLYYQFVSRDIIPNRQTEYKRLGSVINDGHLAGMMSGLGHHHRPYTQPGVTCFTGTHLRAL